MRKTAAEAVKDVLKKDVTKGVAGVVIGAGTATAASAAMEKEVQALEEGDAMSIEQEQLARSVEQTADDGKLHVARNVDNSMSFSEAFEAARAEVGAGGVFHWHGNTYNTFTADEWAAMTAADKADFAELVAPEVQYDVAVQARQHHHEYGHTASTMVEHTEPGVVPGSVADLRGVAIENAYMQVGEDGSAVSVAEGKVGTFDASLADVDHDGFYDVAAVDANRDGEYQDSEYTDVSSQGIAVVNAMPQATDGVVLASAVEVADEGVAIDYGVTCDTSGDPAEPNAVEVALATTADAVNMINQLGVELPKGVADVVGVLGKITGADTANEVTTLSDNTDDTTQDVACNNPVNDIADQVHGIVDLAGDISALF